ncbi:MAG: addiction module protein [Planctomycetota bacterium]|jgi:putative addiction module component (TIGR02574 family)
MSTADLPPEILALPVEDRIRLAMSIWDSIAEESSQLSEDEKRLLDERLRDHLENPNTGESWMVVRERLWKSL